MKFLGTKTVQIEKIVLPGDWKKRLASPHVKELSESFDDTPLLQRPGIRKKDREVIWGRDRLAALYLAGNRAVEVDLWDCTDDELARAVRVENAFRRDPDMAARRELLAQVEQEVEEKRKGWGDDDAPNYGDNVPESPPAKPGRKKSVKAEAREKVAALAGVTPAALAKQEQRESRKKHDDGEKGDGAKSEFHWLSKLSAFETWGVPVDEGYCEAVVRAQAAVDKVTAKLQVAMGAITAAMGELPEGVADEMGLQLSYAQVQRINSGILAARPAALCPYCKDFKRDGLAKDCKGCRGLAFVGKEKAEAAPEELRRRDDAAGVFTSPNVFKRLADLGTPKAAKKRVTVEGVPAE